MVDRHAGKGDLSQQGVVLAQMMLSSAHRSLPFFFVGWLTQDLSLIILRLGSV
jgi:hypothetical protein